MVIPIATVLLPTSLGYPLSVPILLVPPHLFYLALFAVAVFITVFGAAKDFSHRRKMSSSTLY